MCKFIKAYELGLLSTYFLRSKPIAAVFENANNYQTNSYEVIDIANNTELKYLSYSIVNIKIVYYDHICEIVHNLQVAQGRNSKQRIVPYVASARCRHDVQALTKVGWSSEDIAIRLDINLSFVNTKYVKIL